MFHLPHILLNLHVHTMDVLNNGGAPQWQSIISKESSSPQASELLVAFIVNVHSTGHFG